MSDFVIVLVVLRVRLGLRSTYVTCVLHSPNRSRHSLSLKYATN